MAVHLLALGHSGISLFGSPPDDAKALTQVIVITVIDTLFVILLSSITGVLFALLYSYALPLQCYPPALSLLF